MLYVGVDQHKKYSFIVSKDQKGNLVNQFKGYHADKDAIRNYFLALPKDSVVALEACGFAHWLGDLIEGTGLAVKLSHTTKTKAIAEERIKTDKLSANVLADLLRINMLPEAYRAPQDTRMRHRLSLIRLRTMLKNRVHSTIDYLGIQQNFSDLFGKTGREFLAQLELNKPYNSIIESCLELVDDLSSRVKKIDASLRLKLKADSKARLLTTIPGVGLITSYTILAEIGDINRFPNAHKLARYIGIVPSLHQSGQINHSGRITKQGNKYLRTAFVESAQTAIKRDAYLQRYFENIRKKKGYCVAIVAVGHKLVKSTYHILKKGCAYRFRTANNG